jgi:glycolate oxidase
VYLIDQELRALLGDDAVLSGDAAARAYDCDAYTVERSYPTAVVLPRSTVQVLQIVRWCIGRQVPYTARGAGTGLSGGVLPALGGVVISTKRMTSILEVDPANRCLLAQAGVVNKKISDAVREFGLHFAPDPSSQTVATLGGNIAENAGGPHTLKYGVTTQHVLGLTMVSTKGDLVRLGGRVAGGPGYDLISLVIGSEGTLGVVTEAWVKLTPLPTWVETVLVAFPSVRAATQSVADIIALGTIPAALEMLDKGVLKAVGIAFDLTYPQGTEALLLIECDAAGEGAKQKVQAEIETVTRVFERNGALQVETAKDEVERARLWTARKKGIGAMGRLAPSIVTHDGVIPRSKLPEMLDFVYSIADLYGVGVANIFHAGDGNLHPCFYFDDRDPDQIDRVVKAGEDIMKRCIELGGSITGEHGVGVEKLDLMPLMFTPEDLVLQADAKRVFNDDVLCNPCKILPNQKSCVEHRKRWKGVGW